MVRWHGPRGSIEHPASALNLRLALAVFGMVMCAALAVVAGVNGWGVAAVLLGALAVPAAVDIVVIQRRRRRRSNSDFSLFE
jgi:hypothetical protein